MSGVADAPIRVLHVDDNPDYGDIVGQFLEDEHDGFTVETATSGEEALGCLADSDRIDCVVSDYDMPQMDGLELLAAVREDHPDLPFVLFTGKGSEEIASEAISAGVTEYLQKGGGRDSYAILANRIEQAVSAHRAREARAESERRLGFLVQNLPGMAYRCANERGWPMDFVSEGCETLTGYTSDELEAGDVSWGEDVLHPDDQENVWETVQSAVEADDPFQITYRIRTRDGDVRWCWERGRGVREGGEVVALEGVIRDVTDEKRRETELAAERQFTANALNALEDVFFVVDAETEALLRWNDRVPEVLGYDDGQLESMTGTDIIADEDIPAVREAMAEAINAGTATVRASVVTADGEQIPHEFRGTVLDEQEGTIAGVGRNITAQRERERELEQYRTLVANVGDPMYVLDTNGTLEMINEALAEELGYEREEIEGERFDLFLSDADAKRGVELLMEMVETGEKTRRWEMDAITKDGSVIQAENVMSLITDEDGEFVGSVGAVRDISERKERERELQRYETIVQAVGDPVYALDADGRVAFVNEAITDLAGYDPSELVGEHIRKIISEEAVTQGKRLIEEMLKDPDRRAVRYELDVETADGETIPCELHTALLPMEDGEFAGTAGILRDIEERKRREDRLEEFASVVSHDLRGPLNVIVGRVPLAREMDTDEHLDAIENAAERMERLIQDLLTLARQGETVGERSDVDLQTVTEAAWRSVDTDAATLRVPETTTLSADADRFQQLLENLLRNSVEHGPEDVTVAVGSVDDGFYVADDGPGIPEGRRADVFDHGHTTNQDGTGFGLSIVERIAEAHGWSVELTESEAGGARFEFET